MSHHYGRTELAKILGLLLLLALCTSGAEAGGYPLCPQDGREYFYVTNEDGTISCIDTERVQWTWECKHRGEWGEVAALLERCLEYVRDGDKNYLEGSMCDTLLYVEPYRTLKDDARDKLNALDRETKLRRDIEAAIKKLKGE